MQYLGRIYAFVILDFIYFLSDKQNYEFSVLKCYLVTIKQ